MGRPWPAGVGDQNHQTLGCHLWETQANPFIGHKRAVYSVAFSLDGKTSWPAESWDNSIKLWDATSGILIQTLTGHEGGAYSVTFSPDGKTLASGNGDKTIKLWVSE